MRPRQRQGCYFTALMTKLRREGGEGEGAIRGARNNILLIWICSALRPLLHPVDLSDSAISPRAAAIYLIFSLDLTHDFIVPALAGAPEEPVSLSGAGLISSFVQSCITQMRSQLLSIIFNLSASRRQRRRFSPYIRQCVCEV